MLNRFLRGRNRSQGERRVLMGETPANGPAPSEEPLGPASVIRVLSDLPELDWVRLAAVEAVKQAAPGSVKRDEEIYRRAYKSARRWGQYDDLGRTLNWCQETAYKLAEAAAGPDAKAAWDRFTAVVEGRGTLQANPADSKYVEHYLQFADAASNTLKTAALRPFIARKDFAYLWRGYETVLVFRRAAESVVDQDADRMLFGPAGPEVLSILLYLGDTSPDRWGALVNMHLSAVRSGGDTYKRRVLDLIEQGGQRGLKAGLITEDDAVGAKRSAEDAADQALPYLIDRISSNSDEPRELLEVRYRPWLRSAANAVTTFVLVRPFLDDDEAVELWAPYVLISPRPPGDSLVRP
jgi:hypothetical protein